MTETREQAVQKMHANLIHGGDAESCVVCNNLATTLGWPEPLPAPEDMRVARVRAVVNKWLNKPIEVNTNQLGECTFDGRILMLLSEIQEIVGR